MPTGRTEGTFVCASVERGARGLHKSRDFRGIIKLNRGCLENLQQDIWEFFRTRKIFHPLTTNFIDQEIFGLKKREKFCGDIGLQGIG